MLICGRVLSSAFEWERFALCCIGYSGISYYRLAVEPESQVIIFGRMSGLEAGAEVAAMPRRQRDFCIDHRNGRLLIQCLTQALLACLVYVSICGEVAHGYVDAYEQLENYGFPIGLLPHTVLGYDLAENGKFAVYLDKKCEIDIPSAFPVVYSKKIAGRLSYGSLKDLSGIQVKIYFVWLTINAISVQEDSLKFEVGYISASYPIHPNFDENPECVHKFNSQPLYLAAK